jgi:hypothetical protein
VAGWLIVLGRLVVDGAHFLAWSALAKQLETAQGAVSWDVLPHWALFLFTDALLRDLTLGTAASSAWLFAVCRNLRRQRRVWSPIAFAWCVWLSFLAWERWALFSFGYPAVVRMWR